MARYIVLGVFMAVWGTVTIIAIIQSGEVPPEYWTIPGIGIGGILGAFAAFERIELRRRTSTTNESSEEDAT